MTDPRAQDRASLETALKECSFRLAALVAASGDFSDANAKALDMAVAALAAPSTPPATPCTTMANVGVTQPAKFKFAEQIAPSPAAITELRAEANRLGAPPKLKRTLNGLADRLAALLDGATQSQGVTGDRPLEAGSIAPVTDARALADAGERPAPEFHSGQQDAREKAHAEQSTVNALIYATNLVTDRMAVEGPTHAAMLQRYADDLAALVAHLKGQP